jgi:hypothetical protein
MEIGSGIACLVKVGTLTWEAYQLYQEASERYKEVSREMWSLHAYLNMVDERVSNLILTHSQEANLNSARDGCKAALRDLQSIVRKHRDLSLRSRLSFTEDIKKIRGHIKFSFTLLGMFLK